MTTRAPMAMATVTTGHGTVLGYADIPWADARPNLDLWLPKRVRWRVRCTAHRSGDRGPCRAWVVQGDGCVAHGGKAGQVRLAGLRRLALANWQRSRVRLVAQVLAEQADRPGPAGVRLERLSLPRLATRNSPSLGPLFLHFTSRLCLSMSALRAAFLQMAEATR
jgi:hypothetical protein